MAIDIELPKLDRFIWRFSLGRDNGNGSDHFLRVKIPGGSLTTEQLRGIAELSDKYGRGYAEITTRQDIQLHWIEAEDALEIFLEMEKLGFTTDLCGQAFSEVCHGDVRNTVCCPLSGKKGYDAYWLVKEITEFFSGNPDYVRLPHKFKIGISTCENNCIREENHDLTLCWNGDGFVPLVGGGIGASKPGVRKAKNLGILVYEDEAFEFAKAVVDLYREFDAERKGEARFKNFVEKVGCKRIREEIEQRMGVKFERANNFSLNAPSEHLEGLQDDGKFYYTLPVFAGLLDSSKLRFLADVADEFGGIRLTPWQNVLFTDVDDVEALKEHLSEKFDLSKPRMYVACASNFCGKTILHAKDVLRLLPENGGFVAVSGCSNACGCHPLAEIGLCGRVKGGKQLYDVFIHGWKEAENLSVEEMVEYVKRLLGD
ncbi:MULTISPECIES: nitrite/sulfite reductase [unclassified Archaeoglobus]|jgi:sulfite reductase beta subunit-like hemoprotein|uniref:nitrite/sulfite reductase n=1 Tax=unclassified Archaeoglobus TaxID=2643606 RepID=UPI0025BD9579|nr:MULTISPECIES: nitrite/sulfite reductase [unclassified Archaeoglobus]